MKTQIVYVLVASEDTYFLEELWVSLYSLRRFHSTEKVVVLVDEPTAGRIAKCPQLVSLITELKIVPVPDDYSAVLRSREIKTNLRNLIDGDLLFIDTDTVICQPIDEMDFRNIESIAMVPELHDNFNKHLFYEYTYQDTKRIFDLDVSDSQYWFNSGCMFVRDNEFTHSFFQKWNENWKYSALCKHNKSDQRALLATDKSFGYKIECLPDVYNCQLAMSIKYLYDAKILHFWHMRNRFAPDLNYSPFCNKEVYRQVRRDSYISEDTANLIINVKRSFRHVSMIIGEEDIKLLFSPIFRTLGKSYGKSRKMRWFLEKLVRYVELYYKAKAKKWL